MTSETDVDLDALALVATVLHRDDTNQTANLDALLATGDVEHWQRVASVLAGILVGTMPNVAIFLQLARETVLRRDDSERAHDQ
jgi:hypothetical protein